MALLMNSLVIIKAFGIYHVCLSFYSTDALNHGMILQKQVMPVTVKRNPFHAFDDG
jgi:hypothetical protein